MNARIVTVSAAAALALVAGSASAQCSAFFKLQKVSSSPFDRYGAAVAMGHGPTSPLMVVGDPGYDTPAGNDAGSFSVWAKGGGNTWSSVGGSFNGAGGAANEHMGEAVDIADPFIIVSVPDYNGSQGKARVYERGNGYSWTLKSELFAFSPNQGDEMGTSVAVSTYGGGWAVSGAPFHSFHGVSDAGAAFFYTRNADGTWSQAFHIWGADFNGSNNEHRGSSVSMSKTSRYAVVGGPNGSGVGLPAESGVAYIVQRLDNGLVGSPSVINPGASAEAGAHFGASVAVEGDLMVIGAPEDDMTATENFPNGGRTDSGRIYIYERSGNAWTLITTRTADAPVSNQRFGTKLATDGTNIFVTSGQNKVYHLQKLGGVWTQVGAYSDPDNFGTTFGASISTWDSILAVGDQSDSEGNISNRGAAYGFTLPTAIGSDVCWAAAEMPRSEFQVCTEHATASSPANVTTCGTGATQGPDVWYTFTPSCNGNAIIDTFGSDFDTVLSIHSGCPGIFGFNSLYCNDDAGFAAPNNRASLISFNFTAGETYYVRIAGYNGASGVANVRPSFYYNVPNDTCAGAIPVTEGSYTFGNCGAHTEDTNPICPADGFVGRQDVWYSFVPASTGTYTIDTCGSQFDTVLAVYPGCLAQGAAPIACDDDNTSCGLQAGFPVDLVAGTNYRIRVGAFSDGVTGAFNLNIVAPAGPCDGDLNQDGNVDQGDIDYLINVVAGGANPTGIDPDFNRDGNVDQGDIDALINVIAGGNCP